MNKTITFVRNLFFFYKPFFPVLLLMTFILLVIQGIGLGIPLLTGKVVDTLNTGTTLRTVLIIITGITVIRMVESFLSVLQSSIELRIIDARLPRHAQKYSFEKIFGFSLGQHLSENSSIKTSVLTQGENALHDSAQLLFYTFIPIALSIVTSTLALVWINPLLGLGALAMIVMYVLWRVKFQIKLYPEIKKLREKRNDIGKIRSEILRNISLVKLSGREEEVAGEYFVERDAGADLTIATWQKSYNNFFFGDVFLSFSKGLLMVYAATLFFNGSITVGLIITAFAWLQSATSDIGRVGWIVRSITENISNIEKYKTTLDETPWVEEKSGLEKADVQGEIKFNNVSFKYPKKKKDSDAKEVVQESKDDENKDALKDISFTINQGQTAAFVGHSGAGKTTILNLILRGYDPLEGSILIDGTDLRELDMKSYRSQIGYVEQQVELFDNTLEYNVLFGVPENEKVAAKARLDEVARQSRIDQFFERLGEKKWQTEIGEKGVRLSGGERQRVGIARALIKNPKILIFDEATSSLDAENEAIIHEAMREALKGRTGIIIAHRLSTVKDADKIIVMDKGTVAGIGTHSELVETCEPYKRLVARQIVTM